MNRYTNDAPEGLIGNPAVIYNQKNTEIADDGKDPTYVDPNTIYNDSLHEPTQRKHYIIEQDWIVTNTHINNYNIDNNTVTLYISNITIATIYEQCINPYDEEGMNEETLLL